MAHELNELRKQVKAGGVVTWEALEEYMGVVLTNISDGVTESIEEARDEIREEIAAATAKPKRKAAVKADAQENPVPAVADAQPEAAEEGGPFEIPESVPSLVDTDEILDKLFPETAATEADDTAPSEEPTA